MAGRKVSKTEKDSLETHVDLCAERYARLEEKYDELKETFGPKRLERAGIDIREKYVDFPAVTVDHEFYADPNTAGKSI